MNLFMLRFESSKTVPHGRPEIRFSFKRFHVIDEMGPDGGVRGGDLVDQVVEIEDYEVGGDADNEHRIYKCSCWKHVVD